MSRLLPTSFDYTDREFATLKLRLQGLIQSVFPTWTDFSDANFGNILLELMCYVGDVLGFYLNNQADEAFLPTLQQRTSLIRLGQLIGFSLRGASAAYGTVRVSIPHPGVPAGETLPIPAGTRIRSMDPEEPVLFQVIAAAAIPALGTSVEVSVEQSERRYQVFDSTGEPNQAFILESTPFLDDSIDSPSYVGGNLNYGVTAADGDYTRVASFLGYTSTDRVFMVLVDHLDRGILKFGNGVVGAIPQGQVRVGYKIGGGTRGNLEPGRLVVLEDPLFFSPSGAPAAGVSVTNEIATAGGTDRETVAEGKARAPSTLRVQNRCVTREDFEAAAKGVRGVARALMVTSNEYAGIEENTGRLYVVAQGAKYTSGRIAPADASSALLSKVENEIRNNKPPTITFDFTVLSAVWRNVVVDTRIAIRRGYTPAAVGAAVRAALYDFFAAQLSNGLDNPDIDFGANLRDANGTIVGELPWSDIFNVVRDVDGVRKVDEGNRGLLLSTSTVTSTSSSSTRQSVYLLPIEFPRLAGVAITDLESGAVL